MSSPTRSIALSFVLLLAGALWAPSLMAETDELKEWGIQTQGNLSVEDTLGKARQMIDKGNAVSLGGIAKRVMSGEASAPVAVAPVVKAPPADNKPPKRVVRAKPADGQGPGYRVVLANGSAMTALSVRDEKGGYWITAQEGVEAYFTAEEVLSVETLPG